jgi:general secretion pathway protein I
LCLSNAPEDGTLGFTLIEALVALSIVAVALSSIGALIATTVKGTRTVEAKVSRLGVAQSLMAALPDRSQLLSGTLRGDMNGHVWRLDVSPFATKNARPQATAQWIPQTVVMTVQGPDTGAMQVSTVRLQRREGR